VLFLQNAPMLLVNEGSEADFDTQRNASAHPQQQNCFRVLITAFEQVPLTQVTNSLNNSNQQQRVLSSSPFHTSSTPCVAHASSPVT
jgi:hypothetical protein